MRPAVTALNVSVFRPSVKRRALFPVRVEVSVSVNLCFWVEPAQVGQQVISCAFCFSVRVSLGFSFS